MSRLVGLHGTWGQQDQVGAIRSRKRRVVLASERVTFSIVPTMGLGWMSLGRILCVIIIIRVDIYWADPVPRDLHI